MKNKILVGIIGVALALGLLAGTFAGGILVGRATMRSTAASGDVDYALLEQVLTILKQEYYGDIPDPATLSYGAIRGLLTTLDDPYTSFIEPDMARILREDSSGTFEGIGATVQMRDDGYLEVVRPLPGQPAEAAGIHAGDLVITVDGQSIVGMGLYEALGLIRGPAGSEITLEVLRQSEPDALTFTLTRARIELPIVEYEMRDDGIAYVRLTEFDSGATQRVQAALDDLLPQQPTGLIFDLRDNPGGYLSEAVGVADLFLGEGVILIQRDSAGGEQEWQSHDGDSGETIPMVVLINGSSASASEIVAGALQDRGRAPLLGEQSFGKGSVQSPHDLSDGSQFRVTIARWFTPHDHAIHGVGLTPDQVVPFPTDTPAGQDPQLDAAVHYLLVK